VAGHLDDIEDAHWSARVEQVLAKVEPTVPWAEALARLPRTSTCDGVVPDPDGGPVMGCSATAC
jgi:hypothetical protein